MEPRSHHKEGTGSRAIRAACYQNVAICVFAPEKMNILRSAIVTTGIDWGRYFTKDAKGFL
ncbi:hypothetical protein EGM70_06175 [Enterobacteriaceae bacterium 89]|nr:hypothetical protein [Enterobacteriaceae bacterium 89]